MAKPRRKKRTHVVENPDSGKKGPPKSMVFRRGRFGNVIKALEHDLRQVMLPHTATGLKESKRNVLKDFVSVAGPLGVTHFLMLTATQRASYLRVCKVPRGPTLAMRIVNYSLVRDVQAAAKRPRYPPQAFRHPPLVVMNNFGKEDHMALSMAMFQNLFPPIDVQAARLSQCQRVVLLSRSKTTGRISFRHYLVTARASGVSRGVRRLVERRGGGVPDLGHLGDVAELLGAGGEASESEAEDDDARLELAQDFVGRGNVANQQSVVKLHELGPRMELEVVKVEEGLCAGEVLFHAHVQKTDEEKRGLRDKVAERERLRGERRAQQEANVRRKKEEKARLEEEKPKKRRRAEAEGEGAAQAEEDDADWYRDEVGEEPDDDFARVAAARARGSGKERAGRPDWKKKKAKRGGEGGEGAGGRELGAGGAKIGFKQQRQAGVRAGRGRSEKGAERGKKRAKVDKGRRK
ncbi:unnamed protein product [Pedinophyceae sp. YPF-701]|nr:unnamed protein product [Pedinophyceae sp. YPF-701]